MRIRVTNIPPILGPKSAPMLHDELMKARDQIGRLYRAEVVSQIDEAKPFPPVDEGAMRGGIQPKPVPGRLKVSVVPSPVTEAYAIVQELGRRPGQPGPPLAPILAWVRRRLGLSGKAAVRAAHAVRHKLHAEGMPGRGFFGRARRSRSARKQATALVRAAVRRWARRTT